MPASRSIIWAIAVVAVTTAATAVSPAEPSLVATAAAPTGLMTNFQKSPSLGVTAAPQFTWVVPPCAGAADQSQVAFAITVTEEADGNNVWHSGKVTSTNR